MKPFIRDEFWPGGFPSFGHRRVVFDELRDENAFSVLRSWAAYGGGLGTLHAHSVDEVFGRLMGLLGGRGAETIRGAVDIVIRMERPKGDTVPQIAEIVTMAETIGHYLRSGGKELEPTGANGRGNAADEGGLSFMPRLWRQIEDGNWGPTGSFGTSHLALYGRQNEVIEKERMDEMRRIIGEGGRILVVDPKAETNVATTSASSGLVTESLVGRTAQDMHGMLRDVGEYLPTTSAPAPAPDTTGDGKAD